ncbi:MAG: tetratricopeptide repeat protein [Chlorobi bacterium]|nr:tetratricopeptide repeat protein [Chlorobiota bacterium]
MLSEASCFSRTINKRILLVAMVVLVLSPALRSQVNYRYFLSQGNVELSKDNYVGAIKSLNIALSTKKDGFEAYFLRGIAKYSLGDFKGAEMDFSSTLRIHPLYVRAYYFRGIARDRLYEYAHAISDFNRALEIDPFNPEVFMARGDTKMHIKDFKGAVNDYTSSIDLKDDNSSAWLNRGVARHFLKQNQKALADLNKAISLDYFNTEGWLKRGMVEYEIDSLQAALGDFNYSIKLDAKNPYAFFQRGLTYLKLGDTVAALDDYNTVVEMEPNNALTYYNIAIIKSQQKKYKDALEAYSIVVSINPNNVYSFYNRGIINYLMHDFKNAEKDFSRAIEIFPDFAGAYINRSDTRGKLGKTRAAAEDERTAKRIISAVNGESDDYALLYRRYGDSTYFNKIMEFEADFVSGNLKKGRVQFSRVSIAPKPNFFLVYAFELPDSIKMKYGKYEYLDKGIASFNAQNEYGIRFVFTTRQWPVSKEKAKKELHKIDTTILITGDTAAALFMKGAINSTLQNYTTAMDSYNKSIKKDKSLAYAYLNRGATRYELDEFIFAEKEYSNSINISRNTPRAGKKELPPDHQKSLDDFNMAIKLKKGLPFAYYNRANVKVRQQRFQRAIDDYSMAIKLEPKLAEAFFNRALVLLYLDEEKLACSDLSRAGELGINESYNIIKRYCNK